MSLSATIAKIRIRITKNKFAKNVLVIVGGTFFSQIINFIMSPIISRLYTPDDLGVLTLYGSILSFLVIIGSLKYEWAIPIPEGKKTALSIVALCIIILIVVVLCLFSLLICCPHFSYFVDMIQMKNYLYLIPTGVLLIGLYNIFLQWAYRYRNYKGIAKTKYSQTIFGNATKVIMGLFGLAPIGLLLGKIVSESAGFYILANEFLKGKDNIIKSASKKEMTYVAKRYRKFPIFTVPSQILNNAGIQLPILLLSGIYGNKTVGLFGLANTVVNLPMTLLGSSIGDVFYGEVANIGKKNPRKIKRLSKALLKRLVVLGFMPLLIILIFGPTMFSIFFGEQWYEAGVYSRIISPLVFFRFIFTPISRLFSVFERQKEALFIDIIKVVLVYASFQIPKLFYLDSYVTLTFYSISMSFVYLITYLVAQNIINIETKKQTLL